MRHETTNIDAASPWADTAFANHNALRARVNEVFAKKPKNVLPKEPSRYWEDHELHGSGKEIRLRRRGRSSSVDTTRKIAVGLPPIPHRSYNGIAIAAGVVAVGVVGWYVWKKLLDKKHTAVGNIPDWAIT